VNIRVWIRRAVHRCRRGLGKARTLHGFRLRFLLDASVNSSLGGATEFLVEAQLKSLAGVPQEGMSVAVAEATSGLSVDGRNDVSLPDALQRCLAAWVHLTFMRR